MKRQYDNLSTSLLILRIRKCIMKNTAFFNFTFNPYFTAMSFDAFLSQDYAQSGTFFALCAGC